MLMYLGSKRLNPLPDTFLGSRLSSSAGGTGDEDEGMMEGDTFWLLTDCDCCWSEAEDVDSLGELFLRVALLPAPRLQAGESQ